MYRREESRDNALCTDSTDGRLCYCSRSNMTRERERDREGERDIDERIKKQARVPYICQPNQQISIER